MQVRQSFANFALPATQAGRVALFLVAAVVLLIAIGWAMNLSGA